jgi:hypothetical protein
MCSVSARTLNITAALVWYGGGVALLLKGGSLLAEAEALKPRLAWPWMALVVALVLGGLQATFIFNKACRRNLARIAALKKPRLWLFFRPGFFAFLAAMILTGATLSRLAHNNYAFLLGVALMDLVIAVSLLGSSYVFWTEKAFTAERSERRRR